MKKEKSALGLPPGSIRAILAIIVVGITGLGTMAFVGIMAYKGRLSEVGPVIKDLAGWYSIVTMVATYYFMAGQASDTMKETEKIVRNGHGKK